MYQRSVEEPAQFWSEVASEFYWQQKWQEGSELKCNFDVNKGKICVEWFKGAVTNICYNCLDKHVKNGRGDVVAFYWEGNDPADKEEITYERLLLQVCKLSNSLKKLGLTQEL